MSFEKNIVRGSGDKFKRATFDSRYKSKTKSFFLMCGWSLNVFNNHRVHSTGSYVVFYVGNVTFRRPLPLPVWLATTRGRKMSKKNLSCMYARMVPCSVTLNLFPSICMALGALERVFRDTVAPRGIIIHVHDLWMWTGIWLTCTLCETPPS